MTRAVEGAEPDERSRAFGNRVQRAQNRLARARRGPGLHRHRVDVHEEEERRRHRRAHHVLSRRRVLHRPFVQLRSLRQIRPASVRAQRAHVLARRLRGVRAEHAGKSAVVEPPVVRVHVRLAPPAPHRADAVGVLDNLDGLLLRVRQRERLHEKRQRHAALAQQVPGVRDRAQRAPHVPRVAAPQVASAERRARGRGVRRARFGRRNRARVPVRLYPKRRVPDGPAEEGGAASTSLDAHAACHRAGGGAPRPRHGKGPRAPYCL